MGQLKSTLYARMEEVSFRAGAIVAGGVLTATGVAITLAVVLGGHSDAVASASVSRPAIPSVIPPVLAPVSSSPPATPRAPRRTPTPPRDRGRGLPAAIDGPSGSDPQAAATSALGRTPTPRRLVPRTPRPPGPPGWRGWHRSPPWPWPWRWGLSRHHRRR